MIPMVFLPIETPPPRQTQTTSPSTHLPPFLIYSVCLFVWSSDVVGVRIVDVKSLGSLCRLHL
jgi:hypothetical protein